MVVLWRKRRLEGAEQDTVSSAQMKSINDKELKVALGMDEVTMPGWMVEKDGVDPFIMTSVKALPVWMLDENNAPSAADGIDAD